MNKHFAKYKTKPMSIADRRNKNKQKHANTKNKNTPKIITILNYNNEQIPFKQFNQFQIFTDYNVPALELLYLSKVSDFIVIMYNEKESNINYNTYSSNPEFKNTINLKVRSVVEKAEKRDKKKLEIIRMLNLHGLDAANIFNPNKSKSAEIEDNSANGCINTKNNNADLNIGPADGNDLSTDNPAEKDLTLLNLLKLNSTLIFCYKKDPEKAEIKKFLYENRLDAKIVKFDTLFHYLNSLKSHKKIKRPYLVAENAKYSDEHVIVEGYLHNNLVYNKMVCNGLYEFIVEEVMTENRVFKIEDFSKTVDYEGVEVQPEVFQKMQMNDDLEYDFSDNEDDCDKDMLDGNAFMGEKGAADQNNLGTDLITQFQSFDDQPKINPGLLFIKDMKQTENKLLKLKGVGREKVILKLKKNFEGDFKCSVFVLFGMYFLEDNPSMASLFFDNKVPVKSAEDYLIDLGFRIIKASPVVCDGKKVLVKRDSLNVGLMVFAAPITILRSRCIVFSLCEAGKDNQPINSHFVDNQGNSQVSNNTGILNQEITGEQRHNQIDHVYTLFSKDILSRAMIASSPAFENLFVYEEKIFYGYPIKILGNLAKIKGMFTSKSEVDYFKNRMIESRGIKGSIRKSVGKKGIFKAYFEKQIKHGDPVTLKIYRGIEFK